MRFVGSLVLLFASSVFAQNAGDFPIERFRPAVDREGIIDIPSAEVGDHLNYDVGLWFNYSYNPLVALRKFERVGALVEHRVGGNLTGAISLFDWVQLGIDIPVLLHQTTQQDQVGGRLIAENFGTTGLGDIRIEPKLRLIRQSEFGVNAALAVGFTIPSAIPTGQYTGAGNFTFTPELMVSHRYGNDIHVASNLGYRVRPTATLGTLDVGHEVFYGLGFDYDVGNRLPSMGLPDLPIDLSATLAGAVGTFPTVNDLGEAPLEGKIGLAYTITERIQLEGAVGFPILAGAGTPDVRALIGIRYAPRPGTTAVVDEDGDGIVGSADACPNDAEDVDDFEDQDGCPDLDNDDDGIADDADRCPMDAEDKDGFQDDDGCPDPDNDNDGVADSVDDCPLLEGVPEQKGCPVADKDRDGIADSDDKCPDSAEDIDNFEDEDGCPDLDNDKDGIADKDDKCPILAEDKDGFEDSDGCPDYDNDRDGFKDEDDKCPNEPETINGNRDDDGCPDKGKTKVIIKHNKIEILERVYFATNKAAIRKRSFNLLRQVATILRLNPQVTKIRVEGHTDSQGNAQYNKDLSQRRARAVLLFLARQGVTATIESAGFGEERPISPNNTRSGRENNRRVEFNIVEINGKPVADVVKTEVIEVEQ